MTRAAGETTDGLLTATSAVRPSGGAGRQTCIGVDQVSFRRCGAPVRLRTGCGCGPPRMSKRMLEVGGS